MSNGWWLNSISNELEQGDILLDVPFLAVRSPQAYIKPKTLKQNVAGWEETVKRTLHPKEQRPCVVGYEVVAHGLVISHGCDIDKAQNDGKSGSNQRILIAPVTALSTVAAEQHEDILGQRRFSAMPLPEIPNLGDHFGDLRLISPIPRPIVDQCVRVASMRPDAIIRLQAQIEAFFSRTARK